VGVVLAEYSVDGLYRYGVPTEVSARYAISLLDDKGQRLAGTSVPPRNAASSLLPWVEPGQRVRSAGVSRSATAWCCARRPTAHRWGDRQRPVLAGGRAEHHDGLDADRQLAPHPRRRQQAQQALVSETNFPPRHGELHAHRHARDGPAGPHHLRQRRRSAR
jgi:hypothetical protein